MDRFIADGIVYKYCDFCTVLFGDYKTADGRLICKDCYQIATSQS